MRVAPSDIDAFQSDGAVCLRQVLSQEDVALLRRGIDANLASPSPRAKVASRPDDPGRFIEDFCSWQENEHYRRFIFASPLAAIAAALMQSRTVRLYHDHMLTKEPGTRQRTPCLRNCAARIANPNEGWLTVVHGMLTRTTWGEGASPAGLTMDLLTCLRTASDSANAPLAVRAARLAPGPEHGRRLSPSPGKGHSFSSPERSPTLF